MNNNLLLNQLKNQKDRKELDVSTALGGLSDDVRMYKSEIAKLEIVIGEMRESNEHHKKMKEQLERNERTLLDKLASYERELSILQNRINQNDLEAGSMASKTQISESMSLREGVR
jgi:chromosome segregation ATPase